MSNVNPELTIYQAYQTFKVLRKLADNSNSRRVFAKFLGLPERAPLYVAYSNKDAMRKVKWLLGPHAATMYKIWEAQNEEKR